MMSEYDVLYAMVMSNEYEMINHFKRVVNDKKLIEQILDYVSQNSDNMTSFTHVYDKLVAESEIYSQKLKVVWPSQSDITTIEAIDSVRVLDSDGLEERSKAMATLDRLHRIYKDIKSLEYLRDFNQKDVSKLQGGMPKRAAMLVICWHFGVDLIPDYKNMRAYERREFKECLDIYARIFRFNK